jgi:O-antigen/teichoic acid export membrane protein
MEGSGMDDSKVLSTIETSTRTGVHIAGLRAATLLLAFGGSILVARALGPTGRGMFTLPITVLAIMATVGNLGLEHAQVNLAGAGVALRTLWANAAFVAIASGCTIWLIAGAAMVLLGSHAPYGVPTVWWVLTLAQLPFLLQILYWLNLLQLGHRARASAAAGLGGAALQTAVIFALWSRGEMTPFRVLIVIAISNLLTWGILLWLGMRAGMAGRRVDRSVLRRSLRFGLQAGLGIVFVFLLLRVDQLMVQRALGFRDLGLYSLAVTLAELLWLLSAPFATALLPHQVAAEGDDDLRLGFGAARIALSMAIFGAIAAWLIAPSAIRLVYGPDFAGAAWPFRLLLPGVVALAIQRPLGGILMKRGRPGLASIFGGVALVLNVLLNLALLSTVGLSGASLASSVAYLFLAVAYVIATRQPGIADERDLLPRRGDLVVLFRAITGPKDGDEG